MHRILHNLKRAAWTLTALLVPGCSQEPTLSRVLDGKVEVPAAERDALRALFVDVHPSEVELVLDEDPGGYGSRAVRVADGHVVTLRGIGEIDDAALAALRELRHLSLERSHHESFEGLGPWPHLERLSLQFSSLRTLRGISVCCPTLSELHVTHGAIEDLAPLVDLTALERLSLAHAELTSLATAPELSSVKALVLNEGPLESLAGLERFSSLEKLILFGAKRMLDLSTLPSHPSLRELELYQNGLVALSGLPELPSLERLETSDNAILSVQLERLPALRELEMHEADLLSVELALLPSLTAVDLRGEGSLFKDSGRLRRLRIATQPALEQLDLRRNYLRDLSGLAPQPKLWQVRLDRNPFDALEDFSDGFPELRHLSVRRTAVAELPAALVAADVVIDHDPAEVEANYWEEVLREAFENVRATFVEKLPSVGGGSARGSRRKCSLRIATFATPRLDCTGTLEELSGLVHLALTEVDPLSPGAGQNRFPVRATLRVRRGVARLYLKYELDIRGQAEALASYRDPERPWLELGDRRAPEDVRKGFVFAEARPGQPASVSGEAHVLADQLMIWLEGVEDAEGVEYVLEAPYR